MQNVHLSDSQYDFVSKKLQEGLSLSRLTLNDLQDFTHTFVSDFSFSNRPFQEFDLSRSVGLNPQDRTEAAYDLLSLYVETANKTLLLEDNLFPSSAPCHSRFPNNMLICGSEAFHRASLHAQPNWELERFVNRGSGTGFLLQTEILTSEISYEEIKDLYIHVGGFYIEIFTHEVYLFFGKEGIFV